MAGMDSASVIRLVSRIITEAYEQNVVEIRIAPGSGKQSIPVLFRGDGPYTEYPIRIPYLYRDAFMNCIRNLAGIGPEPSSEARCGAILFRQYDGPELRLGVRTIPGASDTEGVEIFFTPLPKIVVSDYISACRTGEQITAGHYFVFFRETASASAEDPRRKRLVISKPHTVMPLVSAPVALEGMTIIPPPRSAGLAGVVVPDRLICRAGQDKTGLFIACPNPPEELLLEIHCNGERFAEPEFTLTDGTGMVTLSDLRPGRYEARLCSGGRAISPAAVFTVVETVFSPLSIRLVRHSFDGDTFMLSFEVEARDSAIEGELAAALLEKEVQTVTLVPDGKGRFQGTVKTSDTGPFRIRLTTQDALAEVMIPGQTDHTRTVFSEMGAQVRFSMMPEPGAIAVRGGYLCRGESWDTPLDIPETLTDTPTLRACTRLESLVLVICDLPVGTYRVQDVGLVAEGEEVKIENPGPLCMVFAGCFAWGQPFEGYTTFIRPGRTSLSLEVPETAAPDTDLTVRVSCGDTDAPVPVLLGVRDMRLTGGNSPGALLGRIIRQDVAAAAGGLLSHGFPDLQSAIRSCQPPESGDTRSPTSRPQDSALFTIIKHLIDDLQRKKADESPADISPPRRPPRPRSAGAASSDGGSKYPDSRNYISQEVEYRIRFQRISNEIQRAFNNLDDVLDRLKEDIAELYHSERIAIYGIDGVRRELVSRFMIGDEVSEIRVPISTDSLVGYAAFKQKIFNVADAYDEEELRRVGPDLNFDSRWDRKTGIVTRQVLVCPIFFHKYLMGAVQLINRNDDNRYSHMDEKTLKELAQTIGIAMYRQKRDERNLGMFGAGHPFRKYLVSLKETDIRTLEKREDVANYLTSALSIPQAEILEALAMYYDMPWVEFDPDTPVPHELMQHLKVSLLRKEHWVPLQGEDNKVIIAVDDPHNLPKIDDIKRLFPSSPLEFRVALKEDISRFIALFAGKEDDEHSEMEDEWLRELNLDDTETIFPDGMTGGDPAPETVVSPLSQAEFPAVLFYKIIPVQGSESVKIPLGGRTGEYCVEAFTLRGGDWADASARLIIEVPDPNA